MSEGVKNLSRKFLAAVLKANYKLGNYREVAWIVGDGRSGTTWVSRLVNYRRGYREMFEPFHPELIEQVNFLLPLEYVRPGQAYPQLETYVDDLVSGRFSHHRVNRFNRSFFYNGILLKDIFANLLCYWACQRHPSIRPILLIRNPFAVALSKAKKHDWLWVMDPLDLWNQRYLQQDYLLEHEDLIHRVSEQGDYVQKQLLIWAIINYVPLQQFNKGELKVLYYEQVYLNPDREISETLRFIKNDPDLPPVKLPARLVNKATRVAGKESTIETNQSPISAWKDELSTSQIDQGYRILMHFGFDKLYGDDGLPRP
ncbi:MAG: hypothetical protein WBM41_14105 [Arenicellales bacterium]|jgi:hypothetical protein